MSIEKYYCFLLLITEKIMLSIKVKNITASDTASDISMWKNRIPSFIPVKIKINATPYLTYSNLL